MPSVIKISDGKYRIWVSAGRGPDGKRARFSKVVKAESAKHAKKLAKDFEKEVLREEVPLPNNMYFRQLWDLYFRDHVMVSCEPKTKEWYERLGKRILPVFGHMRVTQIRETHISGFYAVLQDPTKVIVHEYTDDSGNKKKTALKGGLSPATIAHYRRALNAVFNFAVTYKLIKLNPAHKVATPRIKKGPPNVFIDEDMPSLLEALLKEPLKWQALCMLAITSSIRREDVAGIKWLDFQFAAKRLKISRSVQYIAKQGLQIGPPKTAESLRIIYLPDASLLLLALWKESQYRDLEKRIMYLRNLDIMNKERIEEREKLEARLSNFENEFVWNRPDGQPMMPDSITKYWTRFRIKNNLPHVTFHGLRHTSATISLAEGFSVKAVASRLGDDPSTVLKFYAFALESTDKKIAQMWDDVMSKWHTNGTRIENNAVLSIGGKEKSP